LTDAGFAYVKGTNGVILDTTNNINHILYRPENRWKIVDAGNPVYTAASNRNPLWALMSLLNPVDVKHAKPENAGSIGHPQINIGNREIRCLLPSGALVSMRLFDPAGKELRSLLSGRMLEAGPHTFVLPGKNLMKGTYFLETSISGKRSFDKIVVIN
jgi:hypothetical protein